MDKDLLVNTIVAQGLLVVWLSLAEALGQSNMWALDTKGRSEVESADDRNVTERHHLVSIEGR